MTAQEAELVAHWEKVWQKREARLIRFLEAIPEAYHKRVEPMLELIAERLFVTCGAWARPEDPAFIHWAVWRVKLDDDHPFNHPPPYPLPAALVELWLNNPDAYSQGWCPHCKIQLPCTHSTGEYPNYIRSRSIADACPVCRKDIPPPRYC